jgi:hypothetical protein
MDNPVILVLLLFPVTFGTLWFAIVTILKKVSGMGTTFDVASRQLLRQSSWGSAVINGINARNCLQISEYADGYLLRMPWVFGGGQLWLPKTDLEVGEEKPRQFFFPRRRVLRSGANNVTVYGHLADFVSPQASVRAT